MSLLAELLSKVRYQQSKREIPPNLRDIISISARQAAHRRRIILISSFCLIIVISGLLVIYSMKDIIIHKSITIAKKQVSGTGTQEALLSNTEIQKAEKMEVTQERLAKELKYESPLGQDKKRGLSRRQEIKPEMKAIPEERGSEQIDAYLYSAAKHELNKDYSKALTDYKRILKIDKDNYIVMNNIAYILLRLGLVDESIRYSKMAVDIKGDYVPGLINLAIAYARLGDLSASERYLKRALDIEPANKSVIANLAILYERREDYTKSSEYFQKLSRLGDLEGYLGLARVYEKQDRIKEAWEIYSEIYSLDSLDNKIQQMVRQRLILLSDRLDGER
jgi:tetratricopeptide (TPR) repeat protein